MIGSEADIMYELNDRSDFFGAENHGFSDSDIPEPVEHWSLEDFTDVLQTASR